MKRVTNVIILTTIICYITSCGHNQTQNDRSLKSDTIKQTVRSDSFITRETPLRLKEIVSKIAAVNEVQSAHIGFAGVESENYKNYVALNKVATIEELVQLTNNKNSVVACYSAMALADKKYPDLKTIFIKFLSNDKQVKTFSGCIKSEDAISSELYHKYWNSVADRANDKILIQLDSIILFQKNIYWLLTKRALENRIYNEPYKSQIASLAFDKVNNDAIYYLCNWHKAEYIDKIKKALLIYLKKTNFSSTGTTDYYKTVDQLFSFNDQDIRKEIISKMKNDRHWECEKDRFKFLLEDNNIYNIDKE